MAAWPAPGRRLPRGDQLGRGICSAVASESGHGCDRRGRPPPPAAGRRAGPSSRSPSAPADAAAASGGARTFMVEIEIRGEVPLVEHQCGPATAAHRELRDPKVLRGDAIGCVAYDECYVRSLGGSPRSKRGVVLNGLAHLRLPAQSGRVDQDRDPGPRSSAEGRSRRASCRESETMTRSAPEEPVDQRRLADVRPSDDGEADRVAGLLLLLLVGRQLHDAVE